MLSTAKLVENLQRVRERIARAALRAGRPADSVRLVAVTKYVDAQVTRALAESGCLDLGESRPQELLRKAEALSDLPVRWHLIGSLQRNKVRKSVAAAELIHSVDSAELLAEIDREAARIGKRQRVLLEINISGDSTKHGLASSDVAPLLLHAVDLKHVQVCGLMAMAALEGGAARARENFAAVRALRDQLQSTAPPAISLSELSLGMSGDFEEAIAEGATLVRIGSLLFEE